MENRIPVTLLTGFLGAGKTTLLNRLLKHRTTERIAVIVNEFGDAGLDHDLIAEAAEDVVLMAGGCLCCSIRGDLSKTLISLFERRQGGELEFERIVIETTGLADPAPVHHTLLVDSQLAPHFFLDGIVTIVDAVLGANTLGRHAEARAQVAMADIIVLSKVDLAGVTDLQALKRRLDPLNPGARRIEAVRGEMPVEELFGLSVTSEAPSSANALTWLAQPAQDDRLNALDGISGFSLPKASPMTATFGESTHLSDDRVSTASITLDTPIPAGVFDFWLDTLIALRGSDILRLKGIVHIEDVPKPFVFHGVQHIFEPPVPLEDWPEDDKTSRVVLIARDFSEEDLEQCLAGLTMRPVDGEAVDGLVVHTLKATEA